MSGSKATKAFCAVFTKIAPAMDNARAMPPICACSDLADVIAYSLDSEKVSLPIIMKLIAYDISAGSTTAWMTA